MSKLFCHIHMLHICNNNENATEYGRHDNLPSLMQLLPYKCIHHNVCSSDLCIVRCIVIYLTPCFSSNKNVIMFDSRPFHVYILFEASFAFFHPVYFIFYYDFYFETLNCPLNCPLKNKSVYESVERIMSKVISGATKFQKNQNKTIQNQFAK